MSLDYISMDYYTYSYSLQGGYQIMHSPYERSIERSGVQLAAREMQNVHTVDSLLLCDLSRVAKATPRHKHSGRRRRVGTGKSPAAILQQSPVRYLGDKCCEERQGRDARKVCCFVIS